MVKNGVKFFRRQKITCGIIWKHFNEFMVDFKCSRSFSLRYWSRVLKIVLSWWQTDTSLAKLCGNLRKDGSLLWNILELKTHKPSVLIFLWLRNVLQLSICFVVDLYRFVCPRFRSTTLHSLQPFSLTIENDILPEVAVSKVRSTKQNFTYVDLVSRNFWVVIDLIPIIRY